MRKMVPTPNYECLHEEQLQSHSLQIKELENRADFKDTRIDQIMKDQKRMEEKIDKLTNTVNNIQMKSVMGDSDINTRVTSIESELSTVRWMLGISFTVFGVSIAALAFIMTHLH